MKNYGLVFLIIAVALIGGFLLFKKWLRSKVESIYDSDFSDSSFINLWNAYKAIKK